MSYHDNPQEALFEQRKLQQAEKRRQSRIFMALAQEHLASLPVRTKLFWGMIQISPLLICAIAFLTVMLNTYNSQIATRLPADERILYTTELITVAMILLASVGIYLLGVFKVKFIRIIYCSGVALFVLLMIVYGSFIYSSTTIYTLQPHLEITQTGFSPTQMSSFSGDKIHVSNMSHTVTQTLYVSAATNAKGIPAQLLRPGLTLQPDQSVDILFDSEGTFTLSSLITPGLTLIITITENGSSDGDVIFD